MGVITSSAPSLSLICIPLTAATASAALVYAVLSGASFVPYCDMCVVVTCVKPIVPSPYQAWSPILHGSTSCSPPVITSTSPPALHRGGCSPGRTTGGPSWTAGGSDGGLEGGRTSDCRKEPRYHRPTPGGVQVWRESPARVTGSTSLRFTPKCNTAQAVHSATSQ